MDRRTLLLSGAALAASTRIAWATASYPSKPITFIVPFPPGGPNDIFARLYANELSNLFGQAVVVQNQAGGGGVVGTASAVQSASDGYTLAVTTLGSMAISPHVSSSVPYQVPGDFTMISALTRVPQGLFATASLDAATLPSLLELAKREPGKIACAAAGTAGMSHFAAELFKVETGAEIVVVPYRGAAPATADLVGGHVQLLFADLTGMLPHLREGRVKILALAGTERSPALPDVPTTAEAGYPGMLAENYYCLIGPAALAPNVLARLSSAVKQVSELPQIQKMLLDQGAQTAWTPPEAFKAKVADESAKWQRIVNRTGIRTD